MIQNLPKRAETNMDQNSPKKNCRQKCQKLFSSYILSRMIVMIKRNKETHLLYLLAMKIFLTLKD